MNMITNDKEALSFWMASLLQISDSAYPTGSFSHSYGLEGLIQLGIIDNTDDLQKFLEQEVRHNLRQVDLPILYHAYQDLSDNAFHNLKHWDQLANAVKQPEEFRQASSRMGQQRIELLKNVIQKDLPDGLSWSDLEYHLPCKHVIISNAIESWYLPIPIEATMVSYAYQTYASILTAALKLMRLGQTTVQIMLHNQTPFISQLVDESKKIAPENIGGFTPLLDIAASRHKNAFSRMFLS